MKEFFASNKYFLLVTALASVLVIFLLWIALPGAQAGGRIALVMLMIAAGCVLAICVVSFAWLTGGHTYLSLRQRNRSIPPIAVAQQSMTVSEIQPEKIATPQATQMLPQNVAPQATQKNLRPLRKRHRNASKATAQSTQQAKNIPTPHDAPQPFASRYGYRPESKAVTLFTPHEIAVAPQVSRDNIDNAILDAFQAAQANGYDITAKAIAANMNMSERTVQYRVQKLKERMATVGA